MLRDLLEDHRVRFAGVGLAMPLLHLAIFRALSPSAVPELANGTAFVLATQVNFLVSFHWTWASRRAPVREPLRRLARRALCFNASMAVALLANSAAFWTAHRLVVLPPTASVLAATAVSAGVAYLTSSRLVFARPGVTTEQVVVPPPPGRAGSASSLAAPVALMPATSPR